VRRSALCLLVQRPAGEVAPHQRVLSVAQTGL
jgi:hypothetical protein